MDADIVGDMVNNLDHHPEAWKIPTDGQDGLCVAQSGHILQSYLKIRIYIYIIDYKIKELCYLKNNSSCRFVN